MAIGGTAAGAASVALVGDAMTAPLRTRKAVPRPERAPDRVPEPPDAGSARPGTDTSRCRCGHDAAAHEHYRPGSDCGACGAAQCARYRPAGRKRGRLRAVRRWVRRAG
jgi:hypothetical protein